MLISSKSQDWTEFLSGRITTGTPAYVVKLAELSEGFIHRGSIKIVDNNELTQVRILQQGIAFHERKAVSLEGHASVWQGQVSCYWI